MDVIIYHNPDCGTSRNVLALIRNSGEEPTVIEYLKTPPDRATEADDGYLSETTLSDTRGSRRPVYRLDIGSSDTSTAPPWPKPLKPVRIAAP